jgi:hypothetical protein
VADPDCRPIAKTLKDLLYVCCWFDDFVPPLLVLGWFWRKHVHHTLWSMDVLSLHCCWFGIQQEFLECVVCSSEALMLCWFMAGVSDSFLPVGIAEMLQ